MIHYHKSGLVLRLLEARDLLWIPSYDADAIIGPGVPQFDPVCRFIAVSENHALKAVQNNGSLSCDLFQTASDRRLAGQLRQAGIGEKAEANPDFSYTYMKKPFALV